MGTSPSSLRGIIPSPRFPAEKDRYVLYVNYCYPWSHGAIIALNLKGLQNIIQLVEVDARHKDHGWYFSGRRGPTCDPYTEADGSQNYTRGTIHNIKGEYCSPCSGIKSRARVAVSNESGGIIRMFIESFDHLLPPERREISKKDAALIPPYLRAQIDQFNEKVYLDISNGVYKTALVKSQTEYNQHVTRLFQALDGVEAHLGEPDHYPYLFGHYITDADIRLFTTIVRFDVVYYTLFKCNIKMIRHDYPRIHRWLRRLYWSVGPEVVGGVFKDTTLFYEIKLGYSQWCFDRWAKEDAVVIIPYGPIPDIMPSGH